MNLVAVSVDLHDNHCIKSTTIEFTKPTTVTVWRQLNERNSRVAAGDRLTGVLFTDHTLENQAGDHHMPAGSYRVVSMVTDHQLAPGGDIRLGSISDSK